MNLNGILGLVALVATTACTGTGGYISVPLPATAIVVDPAEFLGDVPCFPQFGDAAAGAQGAMRRYVATLVSVRAGGALDASVELPSSPPTRCSDRVSFQRVVDGTAYFAEIDGYDRDDIRPLGNDGILGSRVMVDEADRFVPPRWRSSCGLPKGARTSSPANAAPDAAATADAATTDAATADAATADAATADAAAPNSVRDARAAESLDTGVVPYGRCTGRALSKDAAPDLEGPVCAIANVAIPIRGCEPLRDANPPKTRTTAITVDLKDALSTTTLTDGGQCLQCGTGPGEIAGFRVALDGASAAPLTAGCRERVTFPLPAGTIANFTITAFGSGASPDAGTCEVAPEVSDGGDAGSTSVSDCRTLRQSDKGTGGIWCTRCFAQALPGVTLRAACDPLSGSRLRPY